MLYKMMTFTLEPGDVAKFGRIAREKRQNKSALIRLLIHDFVKSEERKASSRARQ